LYKAPPVPLWLLSLFFSQLLLYILENGQTQFAIAHVT
jgi:hypothetical protein